MNVIPLSHTTQKLIFYVAQDLNLSVRFDVKQLMNELAVSRIWSIAPPSFIDEKDENDLEVVGGMLEIYSAIPPNTLPVGMDSKKLEEVEVLIEAVRALSEKNCLSFEFQLDATYVGCIEDGVVDRVLQEGLLTPWRNNLSAEGE
ncbi:hypothetical protein CD58_03820 [Pseudomonas brassicacearum]|uniref:hypothetical protein n=1 Tax=Pseudomonas brassicacearum TaxID=930166 RepID=UPI00042E74E2|nr:hypothetical protein [Pseudomonas brassicacearum]AHL32072.1 hypothetical protein CD58_03820 [Pseudomonas brassicacearum]